ncbi:hypothetical protein MRB53_025214 [Persea americana]|uniref:Uncharacterized protein n=1 Tax=Persea americana TaxID=3435 RepID=A0ACC2LFA7_PERAE|nr:hypothetical protein MRB53_025214 [Persea americana]
MTEISRLKVETAAQEKRATELEATLEKQKAKLEANLQAKTDAAFNEGVAEATTLYEAQVLNVSQKVWELRWMVALKETRVLEDHLVYKKPPKFPSSDPGSTSAPIESEARLEVAATKAVQTEVDADTEAAA